MVGLKYLPGEVQEKREVKIFLKAGNTDRPERITDENDHAEQIASPKEDSNHDGYEGN